MIKKTDSIITIPLSTGSGISVIATFSVLGRAKDALNSSFGNATLSRETGERSVAAVDLMKRPSYSSCTKLLYEAVCSSYHMGRTHWSSCQTAGSWVSQVTGPPVDKTDMIGYRKLPNDSRTICSSLPPEGVFKIRGIHRSAEQRACLLRYTRRCGSSDRQFLCQGERSDRNRRGFA